MRPFPLIVVIFSLSVLAAASVVFYQSLESERLAEQSRQERFMRNAAFGVVDELGSELFTMVSAFSYDLMVRRDNGAPINKQTVSDAMFRYRAQARFPELLAGLVCLVRGEGSETEYTEWTERGWVTGAQPDWAELTPLGRPGDTIFSLENPVLKLPLRGGRTVPGEVVAVALRFSPTVVLEQIVPTLVRQQFPDSPDQSYRAEVRNRSLPAAANARPADWEVPLLPSTSFDSWFSYYVSRLKTMARSRLFDRAPRVIDGPVGWSLSVTYLPRGLEDEMAAARARNVFLACGFFFVLALGFLGLYQMLHRAGRRAGEERTFLALVSHELKTPIAVVRSLSENLARGIGTTEVRAKEYGEILVEESERLSRMVGNVLALTAMQGGFASRDLSPVDLGELVRERAEREPAPLGAEVDVVVLIHPGLPPVLGHGPALSAAVDNLVGNAFRHGLDGPGPHRIRMIVEPQTRWRRRGVVFRIEDSGPGFSWSEGRSFFRPFRRGRRAQDEQLPGGGVGLSLVKTTAIAMRGRLTWRSRPGAGTVFSLWLREALP